MKCCDMPDRAETTCCEPKEGSGGFRCHVLAYVSRKYMKREEAEAIFEGLREEIDALKEQLSRIKEEPK